MAIPNCKHLVEQLRDQHPDEWKAAHSGGTRTHDFIRRLAWVLHSTVDRRFGLLGQRGNPDDLSEDAVLFLGDDQGKGGRTPDGQPQSGFDVIARAGSPSAEPAWSDISGPGIAAWVQPTPVPGSSPAPVPPVTPAPPTVDLGPVLAEVAALQRQIGHLADALGGLWASLDEAKRAAQSAEHDARELNAARLAGEFTPPPVAFPAYSGRVPVLGTVTLTPKS